MEQEKKELTIEQAFEALDQIIENMQREEVSLDEAFSLYKQGVALVDGCNKKIEKIQCDIEVINSRENSVPLAK